MASPQPSRCSICKGIKQAPMSLIKSKQRVADHGEVFTPSWMVEAMLDLVKDETERIDQPAPAKRRGLSPEAQQVNDVAVADGRRIVGLLHELVQRDPNASRRRILRSAIKMLRAAFL